MSNLELATTQNVFQIDVQAETMTAHDQKAVLAMQATGLFVAEDERFQEYNEQLIEISEETGKPATMTYDDLIFNNPIFGVPRVMSVDPVIAESESAFYRAHRLIEGHLYGALEQLIYLDEHPSGYDTNRADMPDDKVATAVREMVNLHRSLDPEDFASFRPLFVGLNGYPGPSGLYSESIPSLDLLVHGGSNISSDERARMIANAKNGLHPDRSKQGGLLLKLLEANNPQVQMPEDLRQNLNKHLNALRRSHRGTVKKFVPEALTGSTEGTGGEKDLAKYFAGKIVRSETGVQND